MHKRYLHRVLSTVDIRAAARSAAAATGAHDLFGVSASGLIVPTTAWNRAAAPGPVRCQGTEPDPRAAMIMEAQ